MRYKKNINNAALIEKRVKAVRRRDGIHRSVHADAEGYDPGSRERVENHENIICRG